MTALPEGLTPLTALNHWVVWRLEKRRNGKFTKPPYQLDGRAAKSDDPTTWTTYAAAAKAADRFDGTGFMLLDSGIAAFDLDHCRDPATGAVDQWALAVVDKSGSYAEITPSSTGLRIIGYGSGKNVHRKLKVPNANGVSCEIYRQATRFITVSGNVYRDAPLVNIDAIIDAVLCELDTKKESAKGSANDAGGERDLPPGLVTMLSVRGSGGYPSRSELLFAFLTGAVRAKVADDAIIATCLNASYAGGGIFEHVQENGGHAYVERQIVKARDGAANSDQPKTATGELILSPGTPMHSARALVFSIFTKDELRTLHRHRAAFWSWTGSYYDLVDQETVRSGIWEFLEKAKRREKTKDKDGDEKLETVPFKPKSSLVTEVADALRAVTQLDGRIDPPTWLDDDTSPPPSEFFACGNGLLHLPSGEMFSPTPKYFGLSASEVLHDLFAPEPVKWIAFLHELFGDDQQAIELLQEWFGYSLAPDTSQQKILLIVGPKRSGKGTIARILKRLLGSTSVAGPTMSSLGETFGLEPLITKSLAIVSDARIGPKTNKSAIVERLLTVSGEDQMTIARKFIAAWHGQLQTRFVILTNELPALADGSGALAGRFIVLLLTNSFFGREDRALTDKLLTELPGILNWAIDGYRRLRKRGRFVVPDSAQEAIDDIETLGAPVKAFIHDRGYVTDPRVWMPVDELWEAWKTWSRDQGRDDAGTKQWFGRNLRSAEPRITTSKKARSYKPKPDDERVLSYEASTCLELRFDDDRNRAVRRKAAVPVSANSHSSHFPTL